MNNWYRANVYPDVKLPTDVHVTAIEYQCCS